MNALREGRKVKQYNMQKISKRHFLVYETIAISDKQLNKNKRIARFARSVIFVK